MGKTRTGGKAASEVYDHGEAEPRPTSGGGAYRWTSAEPSQRNLCGAVSADLL